MILLDTNVVSEPYRSRPHAAVQRWLNDRTQGDLFLGTPVVAELHHGVLRLPAGARRDRLAEWVRHVEEKEFAGRILPFDLAASHEFGRVLTVRSRLGRTTGPMDALIAAIALVHGATLATRDVDDFAGIGLDIVNPFDEG